MGLEPQVVKGKLIKIRFTVQSPIDKLNSYLFFISETEKTVWENIISNFSQNNQKGLEGGGHGNANRNKTELVSPEIFKTQSQV